MAEGCDLELGLRIGARHGVDDRGRAAAEAAAASGRTQREHLTIIYKEEVCIFENVSKVQARAIMLLASGGELPRRLSGFDSVKELNLTPSLPTPPPPPASIKGCSYAASALPMKRSLQRFLQKRKLRMQKSNASPY